MITVTDFHSHILPGIDDGSASLNESIAMLKMEAEQGIRQVVATPHFYARHDSPERFLRRRADAEARLREEMEKHPGLPQLEIGAEVYFFRGISESELLTQLTFKEKGCILLEMSQPVWAESIYRELSSIYYDRGIVPIIAHIDRYISRFRTYGIPEKLAELPVLVQANASFFLRSSTRNMALKMLREDKIHLLGSDCHNLNDRSPNLGEAVALISQRLGAEAIRRVNSYGDNVLYGSQ